MAIKVNGSFQEDEEFFTQIISKNKLYNDFANSVII